MAGFYKTKRAFLDDIDVLRVAIKRALPRIIARQNRLHAKLELIGVDSDSVSAPASVLEFMLEDLEDYCDFIESIDPITYSLDKRPPPVLIPDPPPVEVVK